jgi:hypothetical protein
MSTVRVYAVIGVLLALVAAFIYFDRLGYKRGKNDCTVRIQRIEADNQTIRTTIERTVVRYKDKEIEKGLEKWYRD